MRESNGKKKGEGNTRNGNKYLSWAFVEAANFALRYARRPGTFMIARRARPIASWRSRRWRTIACDAQPPCANLFHRFRTFLVHHTQINGSFYRYRIFDWSALREGESMSKPWNEADVGRLLSPQRNPSNASSPAESNSAAVDPLPDLLGAS